MRIGIDARLADYTVGGIARYTVQLTRALCQVASGHELIAIRSHRPQVDAPEIPVPETRVVRTPPHHRLERHTLGWELRGAKLTLLHTPDFIPPKGSWRKVITVHDLAYVRMPWLLTSSSHRYYGAIKRAVHEADAVIAVSEATARDLVELVGAAREKVHVVYEAADQGMAPIARDDAARQVLSRFGVSDPFVLFVGTIEPRKNLLTLVRAIGLLRREIPIRLVVAGPRGWLSEPAFSTLRREADADGVIFLGAVPPSDLQPLYCAAEALALPSLYEGFGLAPLEAMACGTPVVVSNAGSLPEIVGDAGVLIAAEDAEDVANALAWVIGNASYRASLVERGLARAAMFSWDRAARETLAVYERVAAA